MSTPLPGSFLDQLFDRFGQALQPPAWVVDEAQRRIVLLLNHVLQQEPEAQARLKRQSGRVIEAHWRVFNIRLQATPAGLFDIAPAPLMADLTLTLVDDSAWNLAQAALRGDKPPVRIAGDVQLAAEVQWLVDHVRWDLEEDLSRVIGDAPAHALAQVGQGLADALRRFAGGIVPGGPGASTGTAAAPNPAAAAAAGAAAAAAPMTSPGAATPSPFGGLPPQGGPGTTGPLG